MVGKVGERKVPEARDQGPKIIPDDLVSVINDGLYFYEQVKFWMMNPWNSCA